MKRNVNINKSIEFKKWLIDECNISKRVASNHISRCKRIQVILEDDLYNTIVDNKIDMILEKIDSYVLQYTRSIKSAYVLRGTLKHALKKYINYIQFLKCK